MNDFEITFKGSFSSCVEAARRFSAVPALTSAPQPEADIGLVLTNDRVPTPAAWRRFFLKPLHHNQLRLIEVLRQARDAKGDGFLSDDEIVSRTGIRADGLKGVFGGLGLRAKHVPGWPPKEKWWCELLFDYEDRETGAFYRMSDLFAEALQATGK